MNENAGGFATALGNGITQALELDKAGRARRTRRRIILALVVASVLGGGGLALWSWMSRETVITYRTANAAIDDLVVEVNATGNLKPSITVDISSELSGIVREVPVDENDRVKAGDLLARLDDVSLSAQVESAAASVASAQAQVRTAEVNLSDATTAVGRYETLSRRALVSEQELLKARADHDRAEAALSVARASLAIAEANLKLKRIDLDKTVIRAPVDGVVLTRSVDPGQTVAASLSAPVLFVIAGDLAEMKLEAAIDEADIGAVKEQQKARFTVDAWIDRTFEATITDIAFASTTADNVVSYKATLDVDNADLALRPGMTATVSVIVREANGVLTVPVEAFRWAPPAPVASSGGFSLTRLFMPRFPRGTGNANKAPAADGSRTLYRLVDGAPQAVSVHTGASDGDRTEIVSGLDEGDRIITGSTETTK